MDSAQQAEMTNQKFEAEPAPGPSAPAAAPPGEPAETPEAVRRRQFYARPRAEALCGLGEDVDEYLELMESLRADLQPAAGYEALLVEQMGETIWEMRRAQRRREGLALRRIQTSMLAERMRTAVAADKAIQNREPFERLRVALERRGGGGPTAEEIAAFVASRKDDTSPDMREFIRLLESLKKPLEEPARKAALRQARAQLHDLREPYEQIAWTAGRRLEKVDSPENLAALGAPDGEAAAQIHKTEDLCLRRLWRLTNTLAKVRDGGLKKKNSRQSL